MKYFPDLNGKEKLILQIELIYSGKTSLSVGGFAVRGFNVVDACAKQGAHQDRSHFSDLLHRWIKFHDSQGIDIKFPVRPCHGINFKAYKKRLPTQPNS